MERETIVSTATFIMYLTIAPVIVPQLYGINSAAKEGMTPSAMVAIQIAAHSVNPLRFLASMFAFVSLFFFLYPAKARLQEATLVLSILCFVLSKTLLRFVTSSPLSLLSLVSLLEGLNLLLALLMFFSWLRNIFTHRRR